MQTTLIYLFQYYHACSRTIFVELSPFEGGIIPSIEWVSRRDEIDLTDLTLYEYQAYVR